MPLLRYHTFNTTAFTGEANGITAAQSIGHYNGQSHGNSACLVVI